jgi:hypothetical protein
MSEDQTREKSMTEKKLENVLGIGESLKELDNVEKIEVSKADEEKKEKLKERKKYLDDMKTQFETLKSKTDMDFSKEIYKELVMLDMEILRITRKEMEMDPSPRYAETAASLTSSITATVDSLRNVEDTKISQGFEREKIDMKKSAVTGGNITAGIMMAGAYTDIMDKIGEIKKRKEEKEKTIEAEVVSTTTEKEGVKKG